jgi:hypothetical protein
MSWDERFAAPRRRRAGGTGATVVGTAIVHDEMPKLLGRVKDSAEPPGDYPRASMMRISAASIALPR